MSDTAILIEDIGKKYIIGDTQARYKTLRESVASWLAKPINSFRLFSGYSSNSKRIDDFWALRNVSFEVKKGEVVGILGRNGAGKSTLLKILSRITKPTKGSIAIHGRVGSLLEVGTGFHPELTGRENIYLNGAILGMRRSEVQQKFDEIVSFAEIENFLDTPVKRYSSGMYVRLAFAVAAYLEPDILLVDEVLAVGDVAFQKKCLGKMSNVANKEGRTVLFVSHNMGAIRSLCQTAVWLERGTNVVKGRSTDVVDQYLQTLMDSSCSKVMLRDAQRPPGYGEGLRICNIDLNYDRQICHGEPLKIRIDFETNISVYAVGFGIGFCSLEGVRLLSIDSDLLEARRDLPKNYIGSIEVSIDKLHLQPGRYTIDVAARMGDNAGLDYLPSCAQIDVLPGPNTPAMIIRDTGGVRLPASWQWYNV
jgi:lipopolysaccharide transport system ATP-binding protein